MSDSAKDPHEHFIKQRRNLVLISVFLILVNLGGIKFENVNILGNTATVQNPNLFYFLIVISSFYLFWRYHSAFLSIDGNEKIREGSLNYIEKIKELMLIEKILDILKSENNHENVIEDIIFIRKYERNNLHYNTKNTPTICFHTSGNHILYNLAKRHSFETVKPQEDIAPSAFIFDFNEAEFKKIKKYIKLKIYLFSKEHGEYIFPYFLYGVAFGTFIFRCTMALYTLILST
jgi:hypothetical protein